MEAHISSPCRRKLHKGVREGVTVSCRTDQAAIDEFIPVYFEMCRRKNVPAYTRQYLDVGIRSCVQAGAAAVLVCEHKGQACNFAVVTLTGRCRIGWWRWRRRRWRMTSRRPVSSCISRR